MDQANVIVEAIYSMEPPGRFLKKCNDTGEGKELSKRDAVDRVTQAMAYAARGPTKSKKRKEERRRSRSSICLVQKSQGDDVGSRSSPIFDQPTQSQNHTTNSSLQSGSGVASSARGGAVGASNDAPSASEQLHEPGNSIIQLQLLQLPRTSSTTAALPHHLREIPSIKMSIGLNWPNQNVNQTVLAQLLLQTLQQQNQQQLSLQHVLGQNPLGQLLQSQSPLQPASVSHEQLMQMLNQVQQQQQDV